MDALPAWRIQVAPGTHQYVYRSCGYFEYMHRHLVRTFVRVASYLASCAYVHLRYTCDRWLSSCVARGAISLPSRSACDRARGTGPASWAATSRHSEGKTWAPRGFRHTFEDLELAFTWLARPQRHAQRPLSSVLCVTPHNLPRVIMGCIYSSRRRKTRRHFWNLGESQPVSQGEYSAPYGRFMNSPHRVIRRG